MPDYTVNYTILDQITETDRGYIVYLSREETGIEEGESGEEAGGREGEHTREDIALANTLTLMPSEGHEIFEILKILITLEVADPDSQL